MPACLWCGAVIDQPRSRTKRYCSGSCRARAFRQRQAHVKPLSPPEDLALQAVNTSPQRPGEVRAEACLCCGAPLRQSGGRTKRYCSTRCRVRAFHQRQANAKSSSSADATLHEVKACLQRSSEAAIEACLCCGATIMPSIGGHRTKRYCSDRCRVRAFRQRQAKRGCASKEILHLPFAKK
jgi:hypothetical protein